MNKKNKIDESDYRGRYFQIKDIQDCNISCYPNCHTCTYCVGKMSNYFVASHFESSYCTAKEVTA